MDQKCIHIRRQFDLSVDELYLKFASKEGLSTFFGSDQNMELKIGGPYEIFFLMDNPVGMRGGEGNKVLSYLPNKMLSFSWNAPPQYPEIRNQEHRTHVVIEFTQVTERVSALNLYHLGWLEGEKWDEVFEYFKTAWRTAMGWLEDSLG